ncbi:MAG: PD-(D/E)XK nuclease family protein [Candidatus Xenobiia bacterium LiM19]
MKGKQHCRKKSDIMALSLLSPARLDIHPTPLSLRKAVKSLFSGGAECLLGYSAMLYSGFIDILMGSLEEKPGRLTALEQYVLLRALMEEMVRHGDSYFAQLAPFKGFVSMMRSMIDELGEAQILPEDMETVIPSLSEESRPTFKAEKELYQKYLALLTIHNLCDSTTKKRAVLHHLEQGREIPFLNSLKEIHFFSLYRLGELDFQLICKIAERGSSRRGEGLDVYVNLPYDPYRQDAFRYLEPLVSKFESLGDKIPNLTLDFSLTIPDEISAASKDLLRTHIFKSPESLLQAPLIKNDGSVKIIRAGSAEEELNMIWKEVRRLVEAGIETSRIAVAFRRISSNISLLRDSAEKFGLALTFSQGGSLLESSVVKALLGPFQMVGSSFSSREVLKFLNSPFIDFHHLMKDGSLTRADIEEIIISSGIIDDDALPWEAAIRKFRDTLLLEKERTADDEERIIKAERFIDLITSLKRNFSPFRDSAPIERYTARLRAIIRDFGVERRILACSDALSDTKWPLFLLRRELLAFRKFLDLLYEIDRISRLEGMENPDLKGKGRRRVLTLQEFHNLLIEGAGTAGLPPFESPEGISVLEVNDLTGLDFDYLFLGGLTEGQFPERHFENILFRDSDKTVFSKILGRRLLRSTALRHWEENLLFYQALSSAGKKIYLSYSAADEKGDETLPSHFLEHCTALLEGPAVTESEESSPLSLIFGREELDLWIIHTIWCSAHPAESSRRILYRCLQDSGAMKAHLIHLFRRCESERDRQIWIDCRDGNGSPYMGRLVSPEPVRLLNKRWSSSHRWSATQLEEYGRCPFIFFARRLLSLKRTILPEREQEDTVRGIIVHRVLERYYGVMKERGKLPLTGSAEESSLLQHEAALTFSEWEEGHTTGDSSFWEIEKSNICRTLSAWLAFEQKEVKLIPSFFEVGFGDEEPFTLRDGRGAELRFRGWIDRIDVDRDGESYRVLDYKNSRSALYRDKTKEENIGRQSFQIPLYTKAAEVILRQNGLIASENPQRQAGYALLKKPSYIMQTFKDDVWRRYFNDPENAGSPGADERNFIEETSGMIERLRNGFFAPAGEHCDYCDFASICRFAAMGDDDNEH